MLTESANELRTRRRCAVVIGTTTVSSWSCPIDPPPFGARTPTTSKGILLIRIFLPIGFVVPKSWVATVWPMTQTLAALRSSSSSKSRPR